MTRGCVHNVKEVDMMQRRRRRREPTTSIRCDVQGRDVTCRTKRRDCQRRDVMDWRRLRSDFMANPAKIFITI
jgi:hypothetical protein